MYTRGVTSVQNGYLTGFVHTSKSTYSIYSKYNVTLTGRTFALVRVRVGLATCAAILARRRQARNVFGIAIRSGVAGIAQAPG